MPLELKQYDPAGLDAPPTGKVVMTAFNDKLYFVTDAAVVKELGLVADAADLPYTPAAATDWNGDADPGNADDALDQLASRVSANEAKNTVTAAASASGTLTIDCSLGDYFTVTLTENITTISFTNLPASPLGASKVIRITQGAGPYTVAWPASFKWAGGTPVDVSIGSGDIDVLGITSFDQGTTWQATLALAFA